MAGDALRVLALAYRELDTWPLENDEESEMDMVFLGLVGMMDPPRSKAAEAVEPATAWASGRS